LSNQQDPIADLLAHYWPELLAQGRQIVATLLLEGVAEQLPDQDGQTRFLRQLQHLTRRECSRGEMTASRNRPPPTALEGQDQTPPVVVVFPDIPNHDILDLVGEGGMATVFRARDRRSGRIVALKVIRDELADPIQLARFQMEAEAVAQLEHPHIVKLYEAGRWQPACGPELPWLSLEYIEGDTLEQRLLQQSVDAVEAARLLCLLARAVQAAHARGIIHRDLKPANVLLGPPAGDPALNCSLGCPRLVDFGLARRMAGGGPTRLGAVLGTPGYMAPEQAEGRLDVGTPADVYGLGSILYHLLTGCSPFHSDSVMITLQRSRTEPPVPPSRVCPTIPAALNALCLRCLEKDPAQRPTTAELVEMLERFLAGEPAPPQSPPRPVAGVPPRDRSQPGRGFLAWLSVIRTWCFSERR
jgi:serine/threonine-protein kinase